ncbi:hypothetical protein Tco_1015598 [Tanacetum coccineum]|uniref:Uncharacterized protein n=1 Tax=Tanacetum coccineum TaxID=301880 RepID=A0ABQ5FMD3_9ASTR
MSCVRDLNITYDGIKTQTFKKVSIMRELRRKLFKGTDDEDAHIFSTYPASLTMPYNDILFKCPQHDLNNHQKVQIFYTGLDISTRRMLDSKGFIPLMTPTQALKSIQVMADHSRIGMMKQPLRKESKVLTARNYNLRSSQPVVMWYVLWKPSRDFTRLLRPPSGSKGLLHMLTTTVIPTKRFTHFYRLSHSELVDIEKVAVSSSLRSLKPKCTIESRAKRSSINLIRTLFQYTYLSHTVKKRNILRVLRIILVVLPEHPSDTKVFTVKMEILLEPTSNKL